MASDWLPKTCPVKGCISNIFHRTVEGVYVDDETLNGSTGEIRVGNSYDEPKDLPAWKCEQDHEQVEPKAQVHGRARRYSRG